MGMQLEMQGDGPGATAAYQRAERLDPTSAEIPAALAELYARLNRPAEAIAAGERAVKANPTNPEANWILGSLYARMSEMPNTRPADRRTYTERAIANLEKANRNAHPSVPTMLGRLYIANGQYDKAIAMLAPFVSDQPDQVEAVAMLAEAYQAADRDDEAIALLEKSVQDAPELYSTLGQVYQDAGRWTDAARAFAGAVEERPQSLPLRSQWATALLNVGDAQRAREVLEAGSAGNSRNQRALYLLVRSAAPLARLRRGRSDRAPVDRRSTRARSAGRASSRRSSSTRTSTRKSWRCSSRSSPPVSARRMRPISRATRSAAPISISRPRTKSCGSSTRRSRC